MSCVMLLLNLDAKQNWTDTVKILITHGAKVHIKDSVSNHYVCNPVFQFSMIICCDFFNIYKYIWTEVLYT